MEENTGMPTEATAAMEADFEEGFSDGQPQDNGQDVLETDGQESPVEPESEKGEEAQPENEGAGERTEKTDGKKREVIEIDGKEYTPDDIRSVIQAQNAPDYPEAVKNLARNANMSVTDYLAMVENAAIENQVNARVQQLMDQDVNEELARYIAGVEQENEKFKRSQQRAHEEGARKAEMQAQVEAFNRLYPDVDELPRQVIDDITKTGASPVEAYQRYLLEEREKELKILRQEKKNRDTTPGAAKSGAVPVHDAFLLEFMKD